MQKLAIIFLCLYSLSGWANDGLVQVKSKFSVEHTVDRIKAVVSKKGMKVFDSVNHAKSARDFDLKLLPTELVIFGNPRIGTPLMQCSRTIAIDLPQKMLVWKDRSGQVWINYNDPVYIADRHQVGEHCRKSLKKIAGALAKFAAISGGTN